MIESLVVDNDIKATIIDINIEVYELLKLMLGN